MDAKKEGERGAGRKRPSAFSTEDILDVFHEEQEPDPAFTLQRARNVIAALDPSADRAMARRMSS